MKSLILLALFGLSFVSAAQNDTSQTCVACKKITGFLKKISNKVEIDSKLHDKLVELCVGYNFGQMNETTKYCEEQIDMFMNTIRNKVNPDTFCSNIQACSSLGSKSNISFHHFFYQESRACEFCTLAYKKFVEVLTADSTELDIKDMLKDSCRYLGDFAKECDQLVDDYVNSLMDYFKNTLTPVQFCKSIDYCSIANILHLHRVTLHKTQSALNRLMAINAKPINRKPVNDDMNCVICKKLVKFIETQLKDNATDDQIINVLNNVCYVLPSQERPHCHDVVTQYAKNLIQILTQDVDPDFACTLAGVCTNALLKQNIKAKSSNVVCVECQMITHFIQNQLYDYNNEQQIKEFIEHHVCEKVSHFMDEKSCDQFVNVYGPIILQTIAQEIFDPKTFCYKEIHVCKAKTFSGNYNNPHTCQMCINMVEKLHLENTTEIDIERIVKNSCDHLEPHHKIECEMMAKSFAPYIFDVLKHHNDPKQICQSLDICHIPGKVNLLGGHKCTFGPSYWCLSPHHADACSAKTYCDKQNISSARLTNVN